MFRLGFLVIVAAASLAWPVPARQSVRFVAVTGNDAGPGTASAPWRTIQRCLANAQPGDTCSIGSGMFAEHIQITRSGNETSPIRVIGRDDGSTMVMGSISVPGSYVELAHLGISMPDGTRAGLALTGRFVTADAIAVSTLSNALALNNVAVEISGAANTLQRSRLERTCFGLFVYGTAHSVVANEITGMRRTGVRCGDVDYSRLFGAGHRVQRNVLHGIDLTAVGTAHVDCFQTYDNNGPAQALVDVLIEGNLCADAHQGLMFEARFHRMSRAITVRNNVFTRLSAWCANVQDVAQVRFLNNTCDTSGALHGLWCRGGTGAGSCEFKNNILYGRGTAYGVMQAAHLIDGDAKAPGKGNLIFGRSVAGYAADRLNVDPLFVDRQAGDFRLLPASPARDAGVPVTDWPTPVDRDGTPRPQGGAWDAGAYEFTDARPATPTGLRLLPATP